MASDNVANPAQEFQEQAQTTWAAMVALGNRLCEVKQVCDALPPNATPAQLQSLADRIRPLYATVEKQFAALRHTWLQCPLAQRLLWLRDLPETAEDWAEQMLARADLVGEDWIEQIHARAHRGGKEDN